MSVQLVRVSLLSIALALLAAGCAPAAAPTVAPASTVAPVPAPTSAATAKAPAAATTAPAGSSSSDIVRLVVVPGKSKASYRVREQLANVSAPSDAVGVTSAISGTIVGKTDGTLVAEESKFVVDVSTLKSDQSQRDNFLRQNVLQTSRYPNVTFVPTSAAGLPTSVPASGQASFKLTGDLTVRDVTKPITWDVTCQAASSTEGSCHATTSFTFGDVGLTVPRVFSVLSIVDKITLELDVDFQRVN
jgi:polyisoprenoid-binding protein YceI